MLDDPETFEPKWILHRPSKDIRQFDGEFRKAQRAEQSDEAYEALCKLYVGMTRAERRLVLISDEIDDKNSPSDAATYDYAKLIEKVFGAKPAATAGGSPIMKLYGDPSWIGLIEPQAKRGSDDPIEGWARQEFAPVVPLQRFLPSDNKPKKRYPFRSRTKVDLSKAKGKDIGNTIHALMEPLQWDIAAFLKGLRGDSSSRATDPLHQQAVEIIESCLQSTAVAAALTDQPKGAELLKERKFTLIMEEGKVLSGNADRIHLVAGKSATIFDYKSDTCDLDELKAKHSDQMEMYRLATSRIWGIPIAQIKCYLIHVRKGQLVEV
jgi:ATP-dependent exoDNAse (exonuclease V) beta subunit